MVDNLFNHSACGNQGRQPPLNVARADQEDEYSGFVILRLGADAPIGKFHSLNEAAKKMKLEGLARILDEFDLSSSRPLVKSLSADRLLELEQKAAKSDLPPLHSLTRYWRVDIRHRADQVEEIVKRFNGLYEVDSAYQELAVTDPLVDASDDIYADDQDYLDAAPTGIDARWAWTQPNGEGAGIGVIDLEQGWFPNHEDLVAKAPAILYGDNRDGVNGYKGNHGTAVLGEICAEDNTLGVVGIAPSISSIKMVSHYDAGTDTALHVADAIVAAIPNMNPGDLLLLEVQRSFKPTEIDDGDFDAIRLASALGICVIEAAGNGDTDLDAYLNGGGLQILNRGSADFRESGAVMIGASESALPHDRAWFSNFGTRIDCFAWGENVVSCGYGDLDPGSGDNSTYTDTFGGTSSASPIVTGAAAILQGMHEATTGVRLSPTQMRTLLSDPVTGTAQGAGVAGAIGVMPNLRGIIENTLGLIPDVYLRDNTGDIGDTPSVGGISGSPDIIVRPNAVADGQLSFGQGSGTENSATLGYEVESGQDNYIYVRLANRGTNDANNTRATVYWSEVSTLVTPDMWNLIGTTNPINVPQGDTLFVFDPLVWNKAHIPATGHYCFVGLLDQAQDAAPPLPPGPPNFDFNDFSDFIRNNNNVAWRNFNVIDSIPDPSADPVALPFLIAGAPDASRLFDLEIIQRMPKDAEVWIELPLALALKMKGNRLWEPKLDRKRNTGRVRIPMQPRLPMCGIHLPKSARYKARFMVRGSKGMQGGGHSIAIRQLYQGEEVGRVTWQFHRRTKEEEQCK